MMDQLHVEQQCDQAKMLRTPLTDRDCHGTRAGLSAPVTGRTRTQGARSEIYTVKMYQNPRGVSISRYVENPCNYNIEKAT